MSDITIPLWVLPVILTVISYIPSFTYKQRGDYDFGQGITVLFGTISTLVGWLIYAFIV